MDSGFLDAGWGKAADPHFRIAAVNRYLTFLFDK